MPWHTDPSKLSANNWGAERLSRGCRSLCSLLKRGRSAAFADPALTALQAHHVWLPEAAASAFPAVAESLDASLAPEASVSIASLPSLEHVLFDARGRHHVVLRANGAALQLVIEGADVTRGAVAITLLVRGFGAIRQASTHLETLRQVLAPASRRRLLPHWTAMTLKQRAALVALDGRDAGPLDQCCRRPGGGAGRQ